MSNELYSQNGQKTDLHFWVMPNAGFATRRVLDPLIREFEHLNPRVKIRLSIHPWSLAWNRLVEVVKGRFGGNKPDVFQVGTTWVATLAHLGALDKVPHMGVFPNEDHQSSYIWDPGSQADSGEELFCVPWFIDVRALYYRKDLFELVGLSPDLLQDWKGFFNVCTELKKYLRRSGASTNILAPLVLPGQKPSVLMHDIAPWVWGAGGDFFSGDLTVATLDAPETITGCEFYYDLINQGFMVIPERDFELRDFGCGFFNGRYAMQFSGSWPVDSFLNPQYPFSHIEVVNGFDMEMFPAGPHGRFTFLGGSNLAVSSAGQKKDLAWEFVKFLSEPQRQLAHSRGVGALPARLASMDTLFENHSHARRVFMDSIGHARRLPRLVELGSVEQILYQMGTNLLDTIRTGTYNHVRLHEELIKANTEMNSVLSLHRYGSKSTELMK